LTTKSFAAGLSLVEPIDIRGEILSCGFEFLGSTIVLYVNRNQRELHELSHGVDLNIFILTADAALSRVEIHLQVPIADTNNVLHVISKSLSL
jgi:hypothetical protein